jgi:hypothetical protein
MAKAVFQRNQRVWVESVGAWAVVERIEPIWAKGFEEPVKVTYDVGLGRPFLATELRAEDPVADDPKSSAAGGTGQAWRLMRARNKWQASDDTRHHPYPGTYPVVVTDNSDWGGWRVPGAEYDRDPRKIEFQARLIASAPALRALVRQMLELVAEAPEDAPPALQDFARKAVTIERFLMEIAAADNPPSEAKEAAE